VKVTGGPGLASWDRALAVSGRDEATCLPLSGGGSGLVRRQPFLCTNTEFVVGRFP